MENEIIVGLDIGTTKIAAIVGRKLDSGHFEILGIGKSDSTGVNRGTVINIEKTANAIRAAIEEAEAKSNVNIQEVFVGIAGQHIKSIQSRGNIMRKSLEDVISKNDVRTLEDNMYKMIMPPGEEIIDVIAQEYIVDGESGFNDPVGMAGMCLEANFHIITAQVSNIRNIVQSVQKANLVVKGIILEPYASAEAVLDYNDKDAGVVLVDIGGGTTDVAIFKEGIIRHTAVIPLGGNIVTEDIKEGCSIIRNQAEILKTKFGSCLASQCSNEEIVAIPGLRGRQPKEITIKNLAYIIQARMEEILEHVMNEVIVSGYKNRLIAGVVLTGGGAMMKHIQQLAEYKLGMDTRIGYPNEHLAANHEKELQHPMFSTGIGLVIEGIKREEEEKLFSSTHQNTSTTVKSPVTTVEDTNKDEQDKTDETSTTKGKDNGKQSPKRNRFTEWLYKFILVDGDDKELK